mgnify:CR=1 FL=1
MDDKLFIAIQALLVIEKDEVVPKNVKSRIRNAIIALQEDGNIIEVKIDKVLEELGEIEGDPNLEPYIRTQIWNVVSALECKK